MTGHLSSHGRGGAGNMADSTKSPQLKPQDLETPTLKTSVVTTGRGGTGNMAKNRDPAEKRALQDVVPVARRSSNGAAHVGRGGTGNVFKPGSADAEAAAAATKQGSAVSDEKQHHHHHSLLHHSRSRSKGRNSSSDERKSGETAATSVSSAAPEKSLATKGKEWLLGKKQ